MSPEKQRIAIATACGWRITATIKYSWVVISPSNIEVAWSSQGGEMNDKPSSFYLPDYLNDLNAMHEAEKMLNSEHSHEYYVQLSMKVNRPFIATAPQRCEAFLRTLGLWEKDAQ